MKKTLLIFFIFFLWLYQTNAFEEKIKLENTYINLSNSWILSYQNTYKTWEIKLYNFYKILWIDNNILYYIRYYDNKYSIWFCLNRPIDDIVVLSCRYFPDHVIKFKLDKYISIQELEFEYDVNNWLIQIIKKDKKKYLSFIFYNWDNIYINYETFCILLITIIVWFISMITLIKVFILSFKIWFSLTSKKIFFK